MLTYEQQLARNGVTQAQVSQIESMYKKPVTATNTPTSTTKPLVTTNNIPTQYQTPEVMNFAKSLNNPQPTPPINIKPTNQNGAVSSDLLGSNSSYNSVLQQRNTMQKLQDQIMQASMYSPAETQARTDLTQSQQENLELTNKLNNELDRISSTAEISKEQAQGFLSESARRANVLKTGNAIQQSAYSNTLQTAELQRQNQLESFKQLYQFNQPMNVGGSLVDPTTGRVIYSPPQDGFSLSSGQARYAINPSTGQYEQVASLSDTGSTQKTTVIDVNGKKLLIDQSTGQVIKEYDPNDQNDQNAANSPQNILTAVTELLTHSGKGYAVGKSSIFNFIPGTPAASFVDKLNSVKSLLTLPNLALLKGAMSDNDLKFISSAGTSLATSNTQADFDAELNKIITKLQTAIQKVGNTSGSVTWDDL